MVQYHLEKIIFMFMYKILVTRTIPEEGLTMLRNAGYEVEVWDRPSPMSREEFLRSLGDVHGLISLVTERIDAEAIAAAPLLKVVANYRSHFDNFDIWAATQRGVALTYVPMGIQDAIAEYVIGTMITLSRQIIAANTFVHEGQYKRWEPMNFQGTGMKGKTMGILGFGKVGRRVGEIANALGMEVLYTDEETKKVTYPAARRELADMLAHADVLSIHLPPLPTTISLIGAKELHIMKEGSIVINCSRGLAVDESSLVQHLRSGRLGGAILDVFQCENLQECGPNDHTELKNMPNVIMTPEIASSTKEARAYMSTTVAQSIIHVLSGKKPEFVINPEVFD